MQHFNSSVISLREAHDTLQQLSQATPKPGLATADLSDSLHFMSLSSEQSDSRTGVTERPELNPVAGAAIPGLGAGGFDWILGEL